MSGKISDFVHLNRFSTGRRLFTLARVLEAARAAEAATLVSIVEAAIAHDRGTLEKEGLWRQARGQQSSARGRAVEIDNQVDRVLGGMHTTVQVLLATLEPESELAERARAFLARFFPDGAAAITNSDFEDQLATMEHMVEALGAMDADALSALHITHYATQLSLLTPKLKTELSQPTETFRFDTLRAAREVGHENLLAVVATVIAEHPTPEPADREARRTLLAPVWEQNARISANRRRRPAPDVDVDPDTGEEIDRPEEDVTDPEPVDGPVVPSS